jgi:hypothetical protein
MNKVRQVGVKAGPPNTKIISPSASAHIGRAVGDHVTEGGTIKRPADPLVQGTRPPSPTRQRPRPECWSRWPWRGACGDALWQSGSAWPSQPRRPTADANTWRWTWRIWLQGALSHEHRQ